MSFGFRHRTLRRVLSSLLAPSLLASSLLASSLLAFGLGGSAAAAQAPPTLAEQRASRAFDAAKKLGPGELYSFLKPFPKGADLHVHLGSGSSYAETIINDAVEDGLCYNTATMTLVKPTPTCAEGTVPAANAFQDQKLYDAMIDAFSMRSFVPTSGFSGHDQFFITFDRVGAVNKSHMGEWLDEAVARAAAQNEQYLEPMTTPPFGHAATLGRQIGWPSDASKDVTHEQLAKLRDALLAAGLRDEVAADSNYIADAKAQRNTIENCPPPNTPVEKPVNRACYVRVHFLYQVLRAFPPQQVFAQTLLGFEVASADPDFVGINFVQPEDYRIAMKDYHLQMQMVDYLHSVYPKVKISLHAGELAPGLVPPEGLSFHIREAIDLGHALRIGHGVDVLYEKDAPALLKEMADKHIMVEINLTSNDGILGVKGAAHPLAAYRAAHVPVALSTDDEGVSRIDLTHEYVKGAEEQNLTYLDLKTMARTSLEHAFFQGESLWASPDDFTHRKPACAALITAKSFPTDACATFLATSERAQEQWELERRFAVFEAESK
jgi:adenosine deaminase